jgi:hypothetical protein
LLLTARKLRNVKAGSEDAMVMGRHKAKGSLVGSLVLSGDGDGDKYGVHVVVVKLLLWVAAAGRTEVAVEAVGFYRSTLARVPA